MVFFHFLYSRSFSEGLIVELLFVITNSYLKITIINFLHLLQSSLPMFCHPQWPRGLRRGFVAALLLGLLVRTPGGVMEVCLLCLLYIVR